jgi:hypothetical protein
MSKTLTVAAAIQACKAAEETLVNLQKKEADIKQRVDAIREERDEKSFDAHTKGGAAQERVAHLSMELATLLAQQESVVAAIHQAQRNLQSAQVALAGAEQRAKAERVLVLVDKYEKMGLEAHRALQEAFTFLKATQDISAEIKRLGGHVPEWFTFAANLDRALATEKLKIMSPQLVRDLPPPAQRRGLAEVFTEIATGIRTRATATDGQKQEVA